MTEYFAFKDPLWFVALIAIAGLGIFRVLKRQRVWIVPFAAKWHPVTQRSALDVVAIAAAVIGLTLLIAALARPQRFTTRIEYGFEPHDVVLAIDASRSMLSEDYERDGKPINRLDLLKPIAAHFILSRPADRIGIVVFSGKAYTLIPPTLNHARLLWSFEHLEIANFPPGTAIGDGLMLALDNLDRTSHSQLSRSRRPFVVLMSDGSNNAGLFSVDESLSRAKRRATCVYTIAAGTGGYTYIPYIDEKGEKQYDIERSDVDEGMLWTVANETGGEFFRATNAEAIYASFDAIAQRQSLSVPRRQLSTTRELFVWFAGPGVAFVLLAAGLSGRHRRALTAGAGVFRLFRVGVAGPFRP